MSPETIGLVRVLFVRVSVEDAVMYEVRSEVSATVPVEFGRVMVRSAVGSPAESVNS